MSVTHTHTALIPLSDKNIFGRFCDNGLLELAWTRSSD